MPEAIKRIVLLNRLVARSVSKAPSHAKAPIASGKSMFEALDERRKVNSAIEFFGTTDIERDADETEDERKIRCAGLNFIWLRDLKIHQRDPLDGWDVIILKIALNHENRIRTLEGKAAVMVAQFKGAVKALP